MDRTKHADLIVKLQSQFQDASMRFYLEGYRLRFPEEWNRFLSHPSYWFRCFADMLVSPEHCNRWIHTLVDPLQSRSENAATATQQVLLWGNQLANRTGFFSEDVQRTIVDTVGELAK